MTINGPVDPERLDRILEMRRTGSSLQAIGDEFGISRERVRQLINLHGLGIAVENDTPLKRLLVEAELTQAGLAELTVIHVATVERLANRHNRPSSETARAICAVLTERLGRVVTVDEAFPIAETALDGESHD